MKRLPEFSVALAVAALVPLGASTAQADVTFEPDPCVITLAPSYNSNSDGSLSVEVPPSAVTCPAGVTFSQADFPSFGTQFITATGLGGAYLAFSGGITAYDPVANALTTTYPLMLTSYSTFASALEFTQVAPSYNNNSFYLTSGGLFYRLILGRPFTVLSTVAAQPACTVNLASTYAYKWNQEGYFTVPDSVVSCQGFTFNSRDYSLSMNLDSRLPNQGLLSTASRRVFNSSTNSFTTIYELHLTSATQSGSPRPTGARQQMSVSPVTTDTWVFGRFSQSTDGASVTQNSAVYPASAQRYKATLAAPVVIKRATDLAVKTKRTGARAFTLTINADRNASFQNTLAPTYRRQVVLPGTPADHAVVKRGSTIIKKVTLSPFGYAQVSVPDVPGNNRYTVTMAATNDNFAKSVSFRR